MALDIHNFHNLSSVNRVLINQDPQGNEAVETKGSYFLGKVVTWVKDLVGGQDRIAQNQQARNALHSALAVAECQNVADQAMASVLGRNWRTDSHSLSGREVKQVLDKVQHIKMDITGQNRMAAACFGNARALPDSRLIAVAAGSGSPGVVLAAYRIGTAGFEVKNTQLGALLTEERQQNRYPAGVDHDQAVFRRFMTLVAGQPEFNQQTLTNERLEDLAKQAITEHYELLRINFAENHPGLMGYADDCTTCQFPTPSLLTWLEGHVSSSNTFAFTPEEKEIVKDALHHLQAAPQMLGKSLVELNQSAEKVGKTLQVVLNGTNRLNQLFFLSTPNGENEEASNNSLSLMQGLQCDLSILAVRLEDKRKEVMPMPFSAERLTQTYPGTPEDQRWQTGHNPLSRTMPNPDDFREDDPSSELALSFFDHPVLHDRVETPFSVERLTKTDPGTPEHWRGQPDDNSNPLSSTIP